MSTFTERIRLLLDADTTGATSGLSGFRKAVGDADGSMGKFKAGATSALETVKANAGLMAVAAGTALVAFGVKAVSAFTETAKAAIDLSVATGLSVEQSSRWIAVGDDFKVSAEALQTGLGKIAKTLDDTKWAEYGIATRDAGGEARPVNDILLDSFDTLSKVKNETERARIGQQLFGKGYQSLTPILGKTRAEYEKMLATQSDGQVITSAEAAKAEKMRLAQDALSDALKDVTLAFGQVVASASPLVNLLADVATNVATLTAVATGSDAQSLSEPIDKYRKAISGLGDSDADLAKIINALQDLRFETGASQSSMSKAADVFGGFADELGGTDGQIASNLEDLRQAFGELAKASPEDAETTYYAISRIVEAAALGNKKAQEWVDHWGLTADVMQDLSAQLTTTTPSIAEMAKATEADNAAAAEAAKKAGAWRAALETLRGELLKDAAQMWDVEEATLHNDAAYATYVASLTDGNTTLVDARQAQIDQTQALIDTAAKQVEAAGVQADSTKGIGLQIEAMQAMRDKYPLLSADIDAYITKLRLIPTSVATNVTVTGTSARVGNIAHNAKGTTSADPGLSWVGENGPELVDMGAGGQRVYTASQSRHMAGLGASSTPNITVELHGVTNESDMWRRATREVGWLLRAF